MIPTPKFEVRGARTDLHSGMYGVAAAPNPFVASGAESSPA